MKVFCIFFSRVKSVFSFNVCEIRKTVPSSCNRFVFRLLRMINWFRDFVCSKLCVFWIKNLWKRIFRHRCWNLRNRQSWRCINHDRRRHVDNMLWGENWCMFSNRSRSIVSWKWNFACFYRINEILRLMQSHSTDLHLNVLFRVIEYSMSKHQYVTPRHRLNSIDDKFRKFLTLLVINYGASEFSIATAIQSKHIGEDCFSKMLAKRPLCARLCGSHDRS